MPKSTVPDTVVAKDHELEGRSEKATEALARHRWRNTVDPDGPGHTFADYARAIGRSRVVVHNHAKGFALYLERQADPVRPGLTLEDGFRLAGQSVEQQAFSEAIAEGAGEPVGRIARGDNSRRRREIIVTAQERAERKGTDPVDEARDIAARSRNTRDMNARHRAEQRERTGARFLIAEGKLANAKRQILAAMRELDGVDASDEEMELMRASVANLTALLNLLDLRLAGRPDIDWDAELARLGSDS